MSKHLSPFSGSSWLLVTLEEGELSGCDFCGYQLSAVDKYYYHKQADLEICLSCTGSLISARAAMKRMEAENGQA